MLSNNDFIRLDNKKNVMTVSNSKTVSYLVSNLLSKEEGIVHGFSTRDGGVSKEHLATMNLGIERGDSESNILENYKRIAHAIGFEPEDVVFTDQQHTTNVRVVDKNDRGKGLYRPRDYKDIDALVTNDNEVCLTVFGADCFPVLFYDSVGRVIGAAHSGWKGTCREISKNVIREMIGLGAKPENIKAVIGNGICQNCYEVSADLLEHFRNDYQPDNPKQNEYLDNIFMDKGNGKYQLDLAGGIKYTLLEAGILEDNIEVSDICTCCNYKHLFSHRATKGLRGNNAAFIKLK